MCLESMTPRAFGAALSAQAGYAAGVREILACRFEGRPIPDEYLIVDRGKLAGAHSCSAGEASGRSERARFRKTAWPADGHHPPRKELRQAARC